jgi:hypothetical protein
VVSKFLSGSARPVARIARKSAPEAKTRWTREMDRRGDIIDLVRKATARDVS